MDSEAIDELHPLLLEQDMVIDKGDRTARSATTGNSQTQA